MERVLNTFERGLVVRGKAGLVDGTEESLSRLLDVLPSAVYATDETGRITYYNAAAAKLWGREPKIGTDKWCGSWKIFYPDGSPMPQEECPMARTLREGTTVHGQEILVERPDGVRCWVMPHPVPLRNPAGRMVGAVNLLIDISDRKRDEGAIQELNRVLENRVSERTAQLESFCYSIAHDFRQQIRNISVNAHFVKELAGQGGSELDVVIDGLVRAVKHMDQLVTDLLLYARSNSQEFERAEVDLSAVASDIAVSKRAEYPGTEISVQPGMRAIGDPTAISMVLSNLVDNACKYHGPSPARVTVGCENGAFFVRDDGIGFDMEYSEKVFQPFMRLHRDCDIPGTGLGLSNVEHIVQKHGGKVWVESEDDRGATFHFTLPG